VTFVGIAVAVAVIIAIFFLRLQLVLLTPTADNATVLINTLWIVVGNAMWTSIATALTDLEMAPTESAHTTSLNFKSSLFRIVNTYFSLFYIAAKIGSSIKVGSLGDGCTPDATGKPNCLNDLFVQLGIQIVVNWGSFAFALHALPPLLDWALAVFASSSSTRARRARAAASIAAGNAAVARGEANVVPPAVLWLRVSVEAAAPDFTPEPYYMTALLSCGYVMLFSPAFPLTPLLAMFMNAFSNMFDTVRALRGTRRPLPEGAQDIGAWQIIFDMLGLLSIFTNCTVISVTANSGVFGQSWYSGWDSRILFFAIAETLLLLGKCG
jgi:anoctamin-6